MSKLRNFVALFTLDTNYDRSMLVIRANQSLQG